MYVLGLAPAAHGGNRTGRVFTGDRSGDWLFASLHRTGFANQAESVDADDGLRLDGAFVAAAVRCAPPANRPLPEERDNCLPYAAEELELLRPAGGACASAASPGTPPAGCSASGPGRASGTARSTRVEGGPVLLGSYHPSQQNTFTGRLTEEMMDAVFARARELRGRRLAGQVLARLLELAANVVGAVAALALELPRLPLQLTHPGLPLALRIHRLLQVLGLGLDAVRGVCGLVLSVLHVVAPHRPRERGRDVAETAIAAIHGLGDPCQQRIRAARIDMVTTSVLIAEFPAATWPGSGGPTSFGANPGLRPSSTTLLVRARQLTP